MSTAIATLNAALERGAAVRPAVGGFPWFAASLLAAGVSHYRVALPANAALYLTADGPVAVQRDVLEIGMTDVAPFDEQAVVAALRRDQAGESAFPEFLRAIWSAGVVAYEADLAARTCTYHGADGSRYVERYADVRI